MRRCAFSSLGAAATWGLSRAACSRPLDTTWSGSTRSSIEGCDLGECRVPRPDLRLDLRDVEEEHLDGFDAVVHLAALSNDPLGDFDQALTFAINHEATVRLAELARATRCRAIRLRVVLQHVRRDRLRSAEGRDGAVGAAHGVRRIEGTRRALARRPSSPTTSRRSRCVSAPRTVRRRGFDSTSCSTTSSVGRSTTGAVRLQSDGTGVAPVDPRRGHGCCRRGHARGPTRADSRGGVQRRRQRCELSRPGSCGIVGEPSSVTSTSSSPRGQARIHEATASTSRRSPRRSRASSRCGSRGSPSDSSPLPIGPRAWMRRCSRPTASLGSHG